ncbi:MAG TPA: hypothetical protein VLW85_05360 [Myxococcales bacterium]|nr:hypothetical protein [Myxococcales bacterium]
MPAISAASEVDYLLANARHIKSACQKHWAVLKEFGAKDGMLKYLDQSIGAVEAVQAQHVEDSQQQVEQMRLELKDLIGACRASARLVAYGINTDDKAAASALMVGKKFPHSDRGILDYCKSITASVRKYGAKLADFGFTREDQAQMGDTAAAFGKLLATRRKEKSHKRGQSAQREAAVKQLRRAVHFLRALGRRAFGESIERNDFAPVAKMRVAIKKAPAVEAA